ncbi:MAG: thiamine kinase [Gammaproteobacteria bacterium]|jgi:thiamine kinase
MSMLNGVDLQQLDLPFLGPIVEVRRLSHGRTNESTLIRADGQLWVIRIGSLKAQQFGINRVHEEQILRCAGAARLAPQIAYCSIEHDVLITEYLAGVHWQPSALHDARNLERFTRLIQRVHDLPVDLPITDYFQHAENYWRRLVEMNCAVPDNIATMRDRVLEQQQSSPSLAARVTLCHRDITPANVIDYDGQLYLLDWEYAARGDPAFDYAAISNEWGLAIEVLLNSARTSRPALESADLLYRYTCALWELLDSRLD